MKILFICTHNRCRSILAEAIANHYGAGLIEAFSAGSEPSGIIHPITLLQLQNHQIPTHNLKSQSWDDFEQYQADIIITVCDKAAAEPCPLWFGDAQQIHWGLSDPSAVIGSEEEINAAFTKTISILKGRIQQVKSWLGQGIDKASLHQRIAALA